MQGYRGEPRVIHRGTATLRCGVDHDGNWLALEVEGRPSQRVVMPRWMGGVGGMELVVSPDERHVALFIYSGQSSLGFELFALEPQLHRVGGVAETVGLGAAPVFSPTGTWLAMWIGADRMVRGTDEWFESVQDDDAIDRVTVDWSRLFVQRVSTGATAAVDIGTDVPRALDVDVVHGWDTYDRLGWDSEDAIVLHLPWGESHRLSLPPAKTVISVGALE